MSGRIRTMKPEWLDDEALHDAGDTARLMSVCLILLADDYGRGRANEHMLAGRLFPLDGPAGLAKVREGLANLSRAGFATLYEVRGQSYFAVTNWTKHQRVDKPGKPRVPEPEESSLPEVSGVREAVAKVPGVPANVTEPLLPDRDLDLDLRPRPGPVPVPPTRAKPDQPQRVSEILGPLSVGTESPAWRALVRGYADRYERETRVPWMALDANRRQVDAVAAWLEASGRDVSEWLDRWFADPWAKQRRWPWKHAAKDPARFDAPRPTGPVDAKRIRDELDEAVSILRGMFADDPGRERMEDRVRALKRQLSEAVAA